MAALSASAIAMLAAAAIGTVGNWINNSIDRSYNAEQAQLQREWEEKMSNTAYQRQVNDMSLAGLNPYGSFGGSGASVPSGASASHTSPNLFQTASLINSILDSKTARDIALLRNVPPVDDKYTGSSIGFTAK